MTHPGIFSRGESGDAASPTDHHGPHRPGPCFAIVLGLFPLLMLLSGCLPPQAEFEWGLGTSRVTGFMAPLSPAPRGEGAIIVAYKYHHQFIHKGDGSAVLRPTAHVIPVDNSGFFSVSMPADVVSMELLFIAPDRLTDQFRFERQLGMGDITYRATMAPMGDWRSHYYTFLIPQLEHLIVDPRYRLAPEGVQRLSVWLQAQNRRFAPPPDTRADQ